MGLAKVRVHRPASRRPPNRETLDCQAPRAHSIHLPPPTRLLAPLAVLPEAPYVWIDDEDDDYSVDEDPGVYEMLFETMADGSDDEVELEENASDDEVVLEENAEWNAENDSENEASEAQLEG